MFPLSTFGPVTVRLIIVIRLYCLSKQNTFDLVFVTKITIFLCKRIKGKVKTGDLGKLKTPCHPVVNLTIVIVSIKSKITTAVEIGRCRE